MLTEEILSIVASLHSLKPGELEAIQNMLPNLSEAKRVQMRDLLANLQVAETQDLKTERAYHEELEQKYKVYVRKKAVEAEIAERSKEAASVENLIQSI